MTERTTHHATLVIERIYPAEPARVFAAWADRAAKSRWFACHDDWPVAQHELDFRVGGREFLRVIPPGELPHTFEATYHDIVPDQRIVYAYDMHLGDQRISISLATVEFTRVARGTKLVVTEQGVFLDGYDDVAGREEGTRAGLGSLAKFLAHETAVAS